MAEKTKNWQYTRRYIGGAILSSLFLPATASAQTEPLLKLPASIVFLKMDEDGAVPPSEQDRIMWSQFRMNLGALISRIEPIPHNNLLPGGELATGEGKGSAIMSARMAAQRQGYDYLIVYGVVPEAGKTKQRLKKTRNPAVAFSRHVRSKLPFWDWDYTTEEYIETRPSHLDLMGEVHLLDLDGGAPVASAWAEIPKRSKWQKLTSKDKREEVVVQNLAVGIERKIQELSHQNFKHQKSISERYR